MVPNVLSRRMVILKDKAQQATRCLKDYVSGLTRDCLPVGLNSCGIVSTTSQIPWTSLILSILSKFENLLFVCSLL